MAQKKSTNSKKKSATENVKKDTCGIVMPISAIDNCSEAHWGEVLKIIGDSIGDANFEPNLVSNADDVGIIHKRIIQNLYNNPIVVVDVSGKNPNVMFELGIRLAFDKPTIILKDDKTSYSFDTSAIEHLEYPRDLRFSSIVEFKKKLSDKIRNTYDKSKTDPGYSTFLKQFGEFTVAKIEERVGTPEDVILDTLKSLQDSVARLQNSQSSKGISLIQAKEELVEITDNGTRITIEIRGMTVERGYTLRHQLMNMFPSNTFKEIDILPYDNIILSIKFASAPKQRSFEIKLYEFVSAFLARG